ncbi:hypothetical protein F7725_026790 [Dissostichus mawsoni]|uniref:Uncharacterized protein n=1 Tax=Dissostichus mawsoni TaxID=36200 RepID=A0A7J5X831_DISMA|nr:hypothetical protein F7725_026790 [Dissostichus mawsoni]
MVQSAGKVNRRWYLVEDRLQGLKASFREGIKHESGNIHLENAVKLGLLGRVNVAAQIDSAYRRGIDDHNRKVEETDSTTGHDESADSLNPGIFRLIFETMGEGDSTTKLSPFSKDIRHHTECTLRLHGGNSQASGQHIICCRSGRRDNRCLLYRAFLEFVEVKDKTGVGLSNSIKAVLEPLKLKE